MSGHTPGPWEAVDGEAGRLWRVNAVGCCDPFDVNRPLTIADTFGRNATIGTEEDRANALLLAAAPELAEALEEMVRAYAGTSGQEPAHHPIAKARAALAKAGRGRCAVSGATREEVLEGLRSLTTFDDEFFDDGEAEIIRRAVAYLEGHDPRKPYATGFVDGFDTARGKKEPSATPRPAPLLAYSIDLCEHEGEPDFELLKLDPGEDAHDAMVPRDEVAALLAYLAQGPNAAAEARVALEGLMGPEDETDPERAAEVELCAAEARPEDDLRMVCYDGKSWLTTVDMPAEAERLGWRYIQGSLSVDAAEVLLLALACGLATDPEDPDYTEPASLRRLRALAGADAPKES